MSDDSFEPPADVPTSAPVPPPWAAPPYGILPGAVALEVVLGASERAAAYIGRCVAYPAGFELDVRVMLAPGSEGLDPSLDGIYERPDGSDNAAEMLRLSIEFPDGRALTNMGASRPRRWSDEPEGPVLWGMGGGGGGGHFQQDFWVWPLPPAGPIRLDCEWPAAGIALTRAEIDGQLLLDAAGRARPMLPG